MKLKELTPKTKSIILSCIAGVGVVVTGFLSARGARKADERETKKEKVIAYIPAIVSGGATIACIGVSTYISGEEIAALTLACAAATQRFADYRKAVHETVSPEVEAEIDRNFYLKEIDRLEQELAAREHPTDEDDLYEFVDSFSGYTFRARLEDVEDGIAELKKYYKEENCLAWCDVFYVLNNSDVRPYNSALGKELYGGWGWSKAMMNEHFDCTDDFDFDISLVEMADEKPNVRIIAYSVLPEGCYMEY